MLADPIFRICSFHGSQYLSCDCSQDESPTHSDTYYTYTPVSESSKDMSNYTFPRDPSNVPYQIQGYIVDSHIPTHPIRFMTQIHMQTGEKWTHAPTCMKRKHQ